MKREIRSQKDIFNDFTSLSFKVRSLGAIVQNSGEGSEPSNEEMAEWLERFQESVERFKNLREDVENLYDKVGMGKFEVEITVKGCIVKVRVVNRETEEVKEEIHEALFGEPESMGKSIANSIVNKMRAKTEEEVIIKYTV